MPSDRIEPPSDRDEDDHPWRGALISSELTPCVDCGRPVAAHRANQTVPDA